MKEKTKNIKFRNQQNHNSQFDLLRVETLLNRDDLDHSPEDLHRVEFFIIMFIEEGKGAHTIDFADFKCSKGTLLTIRKEQIHKFIKSDSLKGPILLFTDEFLIKYLEEIEARKTIFLFNEFLGSPKLQLSKIDFKNIQTIIKRIEEEYFKTNDKHTMSILRSELHILITKLYRIKATKKNIDFEKKYLNEFVKFQALAETNVLKTNKVLDYASMMGLSSKTLNTITRSIIHQSAKEFIDAICIKQIKRLLINTELAIKEVAYQAGFEETTNFYKYFKRHTKSTPEQFRTAH